MKLPPMALTAPSLCPRCDSPAMFEDHCVHCHLQLRQCGACRGVSGPFDRYCGFCGHELVLGRKRSPLWRLWLVAALIPLAGTLAFEISPLSVPATSAVANIVKPQPVLQMRHLRSVTLNFDYAIPADWQAYDMTQDQKQPEPFIVASRQDADYASAVGAHGNLLSLTPQGSVAVLGRLPVNAPAADPSDPVGVLSSEMTQLVTQPPPGVKVKVVRAPHAITVHGRAAAEAVVQVTKEGRTFYLERAYVAVPGAAAGSGTMPLFMIEAVSPGGSWSTDQAAIEALVRSVSFPAKATGA